MAELSLFLLPLLFLHTLHLKAEHSPSAYPKPDTSNENFIVTSCKAILFPALCVQSLSPHASSIRRSNRLLAQTALSVSLTTTRSAAAFVAKLTKVRGIKEREYQAVSDCIENMGDSVDRLRQSVGELGAIGRTVGGHEFSWHLSNVQTWVSAALTDDVTFSDGFSDRRLDGNVKIAVRRRVVRVAQVTSNALALVNGFAAKHGFEG